MIEVREIGWWYWLATTLLLAVSFAGIGPALPLALALTGVQAVHFGFRDRSPVAFPVQVRIAYLGLLALGLWPPLRWVHAVQLVGTSAMVLAGYCLLARLLSLMPWNRRQPLTPRLVAVTLFSRPVKGSILGAGFQHEATAAGP